MQAEGVGPAEIQKRLGAARGEGITGAANNGPAPGAVAPDFELTPLKIYEFKTEKVEITRENAEQLYAPVRLSAFRGEAPVALIFGSYT